MYDNPLYFTALSDSPLDTGAGLPPLPAVLDPDLVDLADPEREVLLSVQPTFVQRAAVPFDVGALTHVGALADADLLMDGNAPGGRPVGLDG